MSELSAIDRARRNQPSNNIAAIPKCPHCGEELGGLAQFYWELPHSVMVAIYCPNSACLKALHFGIIPKAQEQPMIARPS